MMKIIDIKHRKTGKTRTDGRYPFENKINVTTINSVRFVGVRLNCTD